ncbi:hypothetical protein [Rhizobium sp. BK251]|uniref:hypothetical protein n=1 Tax=Rhizobium sp. BK251 TaxID=2512125 RepID=UPI0010491ED5|nr:hypothetical protein [Rhizobium sp. BK251]TCL63629.1 hypothetical protein EV286_11624 [Rhizobium sp. BK251]
MESEELIRAHLAAARELAVTDGLKLLTYLIEMAILENACEPDQEYIVLKAPPPLVMDFLHGN